MGLSRPRGIHLKQQERGKTEMQAALIGPIWDKRGKHLKPSRYIIKYLKIIGRVEQKNS